MEVLNYTGRTIGLASEKGTPVMGMPSNGHASCETIETKKVRHFGTIPIYKQSVSRVNGLPDPDVNMEKLYIVTNEVAQAKRHTRFDLLVLEDPVNIEGYIYYKKVVNI